MDPMLLMRDLVEALSEERPFSNTLTTKTPLSPQKLSILM
jgi:hypothetical protein